MWPRAVGMSATRVQVFVDGSYRSTRFWLPWLRCRRPGRRSRRPLPFSAVPDRWLRTAGKSARDVHPAAAFAVSSTQVFFWSA